MHMDHMIVHSSAGIPGGGGGGGLYIISLANTLHVTCDFDSFTVDLQSTSRITTLGGASEKCPYSRSVVIPEVPLCITVGCDFALGIEILSLFANCYIRSRY